MNEEDKQKKDEDKPKKEEKRRFSYHAHVLALQGEVTHPIQQRIEPQAPSAVSAFGGFSVARADAFNLLDIVSHRGARSRAEAGYNPNTDEHYVLASVVLEGLNISDVVTVDRMVARLTVVHSEKQEDPFISPQGSTIENLRIAGHPVQFESLVGTYHTLDTMQKVRDEYESSQKFRDGLHEDACVGKGMLLPEKVRMFFPWRHHQSNGKLPEFRGHTIVPLFRFVDPKVPGIEIHGGVIHIQHFGRLHIGELFIGRDDRRVTMLHADLGSPQHVTIIADSVCGGASPSDPP
jgi:hypothetical protein